MDRTDTIAALNGLLQILYRSLPLYLDGKRHWAPRGREEIAGAVAEIARDYQAYIQRVADRIYRWDGCIEPGQFPLEFTAMHDLGLDYLLKELVERQRRDVVAIGRCAEAVSDCPEARALAEEILGNARGHLDNLEELAANGEAVSA
ncbi:MAG: hypothetical protein GXY83_36440 [Rhodopirellula sp.]|nr:hypothetical protein [Rhodopirellula sp.]